MDFREFVRSPAVDQQDSITLQLILQLQLSEEELKKLSPLWRAVLGNYLFSVEQMVQCTGTNVNELCGVYRHSPLELNEKSTILHALLQMNPCSKNERLIRMITNLGADLQARDSRGRTVLHFAARLRQVSLIEMLLDKGAELHVTDNEGVTPLLEAARGKLADTVVPWLMKRGADIFCKDSYNRNALYMVSCAPYVEHVDLAKLLIEKGVSLDDRANSSQFQPIHHATLNGKNELLNLFLDHGADVNLRMNSGAFPLYYTVRFWRNLSAAVLKTLLKRGANIDIRTKIEGQTALHIACRWMMHENMRENIEVLVSFGADVLVEDREGKTPFSCLINRRYKDEPSIRLMLKTLALKKVCLSSIELQDERLIRKYPKYWNYYQDCIGQIERMKIARFIDTCTLFELITKCHCQIAVLFRNSDFEINFTNYDLSEFSKYAEDIRRTFERAQTNYHSTLEYEDVVNDAFYNTLPYIIVEKVAHCMLNCSCDFARSLQTNT